MKGEWKGRSSVWSAYNPNWSSTGTAPVIGNGSVGGRFSPGNTINFVAYVIPGSTTTYGTGTYRIDLPATPIFGSANALLLKVRVGSSYYTGCVLEVSGVTATLGVDTGAAGGALALLSPTVPGTFANGSYFAVAGTYEAAS